MSLSRANTPRLLHLTTDDVIHVQFEDVFRPRFEITDLVSGTSKPYHGNYSLQFRGAGQSIEEIKQFRLITVKIRFIAVSAVLEFCLIY